MYSVVVQWLGERELSLPVLENQSHVVTLALLLYQAAGQLASALDHFLCALDLQ
jgi:hypothetical protein